MVKDETYQGYELIPTDSRNEEEKWQLAVLNKSISKENQDAIRKLGLTFAEFKLKASDYSFFNKYNSFNLEFDPEEKLDDATFFISRQITPEEVKEYESQWIREKDSIAALKNAGLLSKDLKEVRFGFSESHLVDLVLNKELLLDYFQKTENESFSSIPDLMNKLYEDTLHNLINKKDYKKRGKFRDWNESSEKLLQLIKLVPQNLSEEIKKEMFERIKFALDLDPDLTAAELDRDLYSQPGLSKIKLAKNAFEVYAAGL